MIEIENYNFPLGDDSIKNLEKQRGIILPKDYKEFLSKYNGGTPKYMNTFRLMDSNNDSDSNIDNFLGIDHPCETLSMRYIFEFFGTRVPKPLLPIARDPFGNLICICTQGDNYGKVYFWDHEDEGMDNNEPWWKNIYLIANSFIEFMNGLFEFDIDDEGNKIYKFQDGTVKKIPKK